MEVIGTETKAFHWVRILLCTWNSSEVVTFTVLPPKESLSSPPNELVSPFVVVCFEA